MYATIMSCAQGERWKRVGCLGNSFLTAAVVVTMSWLFIDGLMLGVKSFQKASVFCCVLGPFPVWLGLYMSFCSTSAMISSMVDIFDVGAGL